MIAKKGFQKGQIANPAGRPTKQETIERKRVAYEKELEDPLYALGCSNLEIEAMALAMAHDSQRALDLILRITAMRLSADLKAAEGEGVEVVEEPDHVDFF